MSFEACKDVLVIQSSTEAAIPHYMKDAKNQYSKHCKLFSWNATIWKPHVSSFQPGEFIHTLGDAHIYLNHVEPLKVQVSTCSVFLYPFVFHDAYPIQSYLGLINIILQILICVTSHFYPNNCSTLGSVQLRSQTETQYKHDWNVHQGTVLEPSYRYRICTLTFDFIIPKP